MNRFSSRTWALSLAVALVVAAVTGSAFAILGGFKVNYGGAFHVAPDAATPTNLIAQGRLVGLAPFGNSTLAFRVTLDSVPAPDKITQGGFVLTAANGDEARGGLIGGASEPDANGYRRWRGQYRFVSGTGRFAGVKGSGNWTAITRNGPDGNGVVSFFFDGTIGN